MNRQQIANEKFDCPTCRAKAGEPCRDMSRYAALNGGRTNAHPHPRRVAEARKAGY